MWYNDFEDKQMKHRQINNVSLVASDIHIDDVIKVGSDNCLRIDKIPADLQAAFDSMHQKVQHSMIISHNAELLEQHKIPMSRSSTR